MTKRDQTLENDTTEEIIDAASEDEETVDEMKMKYGKDYDKKMMKGKKYKKMKYEETENEGEELEEMHGKKQKPGRIMGAIRTVKYASIDLYHTYPFSWWCNTRYFFSNLKFFWPHIVGFRDFDHHYTMELFCDSLERLAHGLKRWDNCTRSETNYRRCLFAARNLRKAYAEESYKDKSYMSLSKKNPIKWVPMGNNGYTQMTHDYSVSEEYYRKMFDVIHKRQQKSEARSKKEAWAYIHKHYESWWD